MPSISRTISTLLFLACILVCSGCHTREGAVGDLPEIRAPERAPVPTSDAVLREARSDFTCGGQPIHPGLIYEFLPWFEDHGPVTVAIELPSGQEATRYFHTNVRQRVGWTVCNVKSLLPHCWDNEPTVNAPEFGYQRVGVLADGTQVLRTYYCMGGSGTFMSLVFIRFETEGSFDIWMKPYTRVVMKALCVYPMGDRDDGKVQVLKDHVIVGPSRCRDKEVVLKLE